MKIKGKTALVTGGAHRLGKAISLALAKAGANIVVNYHASRQKALETAEEIRALGVEVLPVQANIGEYAEVESMITQATKKFSSVDILVNSASPWIKTPFPVKNLDDWHYVTNAVINGSFYCANLLAPQMLEKDEGSIINILDETAFLPKPNYTAHSVGKSALLGLTRQLALELAPTISVNAVALGPILPPPHYSAEKLTQTAQDTLLNRWGTKEDVVSAVLFLISSSYITGEVLTVDGGERFAHMKIKS